MKKSYFLLVILLSTMSCATHAVDEGEVRATLEYAAAPDVVLTRSEYTNTLQQFDQLPTTEQNTLRSLLDLVVVKHMRGLISNKEVWSTIGATAIGAVKGEITGFLFAAAPSIYQEEKFELSDFMMQAIPGFVAGAAAGLASHLLKKMDLTLKPYSSAAISGLVNSLFIPTGLTTLLSTGISSASAIAVTAATNIALPELEKAGGITSLLLASAPSYETAKTEETKSLTRPPTESRPIQKQYGNVIAKTAVNIGKILDRTGTTIPKLIREPVEAMVLGAFTGFVLDQILGVTFFPQIGAEYYAILGALQGLMNYARLKNIPLNVPVHLAAHTAASSLLLAFTNKSAAEASTKILITYETLIPVAISSVMEFSRMRYGGLPAFIRAILQELKPADDPLVRLGSENLTQWRNQALVTR